MKILILAAGLFLSVGFAIGAIDQTINPTVAPTYSIASRGPNHKVWERVRWETNALGRAVARTNSYTELETGIHRLAGGKWVESSTEIVPVIDGAAATNCQHQVYFSGDANTQGAVRLATADGKVLSSHVMGLAYFDTASQSNVLIAELQSSVGHIIPPEQVIYSNALTGDCSADLLYHNAKAGIEQNIIIRSAPPSPSEYGLNPATTMFQVWTEFETNTPGPGVLSDVVPGAGQGFAGMSDQQLDFGAMKIGVGTAFLIGDSRRSSRNVRVLKQWVVLNNRRFLVEQIPLKSIAAQVQALPPAVSATNPPTGAMLRRSFPPSMHYAQRSVRPMLLAKLEEKPKPGFLVDYNMLTSATNFTFQCDTTYYCSGTVNLSGTTVLEGGAVIKFTNTTSATVWLRPGSTDTAIVCKTGPYRMAVLTSKDDNSIGETIPGSTGSPPTNGVATYLANFSNNDELVNHVRFAYAGTAFVGYSGDGPALWHCQFFHCGNCIEIPGAPSTTVHNILASHCDAVTFGASIQGEHVTADACTAIVRDDDFNISALTNSILSGVSEGTNQVTYYNSVLAASGAGLYQAVGGASYYLAANSPYRNAGTTNINTNLLASLMQKTTYPPIVFSSPTLTNDMVFLPQAQRDTDAPDLGWHYDPLDYALGHIWLENAAFTVQPGTAIGTFANSSGDYGFAIASGAELICEGTPANLNRIVRNTLVQEQSTTNWNAVGDSVLGPYTGTSVIPNASFRFTDFSMAAQEAHLFEGNWDNIFIHFSDCQFHSGLVSTAQPALNTTNCLFERTYVGLYGNSYAFDQVFRNNLFFGGKLELQQDVGGNWIFRDNLFDQTTILTNGVAVDNAYAGYTPGSDLLTPTNANDVVAVLAWQAGPLGNFYQPTNSAFLDKGSVTNAALVGFYHYTSSTNQMKEGTTRLNIGFHYAAVGANGPIDTDGDGVADYLEDTNGDGAYNTGDLANWNSSDTDGDGVSDYIEYIQGRNPRISGTASDTSNAIKLYPYTPLK